MKKKLILFAALCALVVMGVIFYRNQKAQAVGCNVYTSSSTPVPAGYGAWYDVFSPSVLLLNVDCGSAKAFTVGKGSSSQIVYEKGWKWHASANQWKEIVFTGATRYKDASGNPLPWFVGSASTIISSAIIGVGTNYVVGFVCTDQAGTWKCGCSDTACKEGKWQLQAFVSEPIPPVDCTKASQLAPGQVITLPNGTVDKFYCYPLPPIILPGSTGGFCADEVALKSGILPPGIQVRSGRPPRIITPPPGVATKSGTYEFTVKQIMIRPDLVNPENPCTPPEEGWVQDYSLTIDP